jgi:hypothetical protein
MMVAALSRALGSTASSLLLHLIHGDIGMLNELGDGSSILREEADADTGAD